MSQTPTLADAKRAAAMVIHFGRRDVDGVNEVIRAVNADGDAAEATARLLFATLELYAGLLPTLHTPRGLALFSQMVVDLASVDLDEQP